MVDLVPREVQLPLPERRARRKTRLSALAAEQPLSSEEEEAENFARQLHRQGDHSTEAILQLFDLLKKIHATNKRGRAAAAQGCTWTTGMFVHGGVAGLRGNTTRMKWCTRFLVETAKKLCKHHEFSALGLLENTQMGCHKDSHNDVETENALVMLKRPDTGGELWLEANEPLPDDVVYKQVTKKNTVGGVLHDLQEGSPIYSNPRRWHEVQPWSGDRVVMVLYSPRATRLHYRDRDTMEFAGFPIGSLDPVEPELHLLQPLLSEEPATLDESLISLTEDQEQLIEDLEERSARLRLLLEEEEALLEECRRAGVQAADEVENVRGILEDMIEDITKHKRVLRQEQQLRCLRAATMAQSEIDYERLLDELKGDLEVVHTVPVEQVKAALPKWLPAMSKEVNQLLNGTLKPIPLSQARELERQGKLKIVPSKAVCTLKPPSIKGEKARRRFRLVLCGNFAVRDDVAYDLYAGGASAETVRIALTVAAGRKWKGATSDITAAFLLADWPRELARYAIVPPRMLIDAGFISSNEAWEVLKPLYGLRESPAIWSKCRTKRLASARIPWKGKIIILKPSDADPDLWLAYDSEDNLRAQGSLLGLLITYVDDLLYLAEQSLVEAIHEWVEVEWPCSALEWASDKAGTRYLGMEIHQRDDFSFEVSQEGYIKELLRGHDMMETLGTRLPCPKEWLQEGELQDECENYSNEELKFAQRVVGEQLWLTMRTRPDLQFPVAFMASKVSKLPNRVAQIGRRILSYLKSTQSLKLVTGVDAKDAIDPSSALSGYSDASFSPYGDKSYGASVVMVLNSPVSWKSSKQTFVTLSVMEAELYETTNAVTLMESVASILDEVLGCRVTRTLRVDNSSALSMIQGGPGSWRTRHLKVRSAKIRDLVESNQLIVEHITGDLQVADLATKMHSKMRLWELLRLWGFKDLPEEAVQALNTKGLYLAMLAMAMLITPVDASSTSPKASLSTVGVDELLLVTVLVCVTAVVAWEAIKGVCRYLVGFFRETPKQRRLRKLREAARAAAEEEVDKAFVMKQQDEEPLQGPVVPPPPPEPHPVRRFQPSKKPMCPQLSRVSMSQCHQGLSTRPIR